MTRGTKELLRRYADKYERTFPSPDPSEVMLAAKGDDSNREATAFVASCLSFGAIMQFKPKIEQLVTFAGGDMDGWIRSGAFERDVGPDASTCFYRFFTFETMNSFLGAYRRLMSEHATLGAFVRGAVAADCGGLGAVAAICRWFAEHGPCAPVPQDAHSACKHVCMFLRWMVRSGSPVDLGLWAVFIDRRSLVMPLDTHVLQQANRLGLLKGTCASMGAARRLTAAMLEVFPDDPLKGDFALFGYGVNH